MVVSNDLFDGMKVLHTMTVFFTAGGTTTPGGSVVGDPRVYFRLPSLLMVILNDLFVKVLHDIKFLFTAEGTTATG